MATATLAPTKIRTAPSGSEMPAKSKPRALKATMSSAFNPEQQHRMICEAAYFRAERRGFVGGDPLQDWIEAEREVTRDAPSGS